MANDTPVSKKYRILKNENTDTWDRISFWTKGSDVHFNDDSTVQSLKPTNTLRRNTSYSIGDVAFEKTASSNYMLYCEVAGITAATTPSGYANATRGILITDGTAKFRVYDIIPLSLIMSEECTVPSLSVVDDLKSKLVASDNTNFYFGKHSNGYYGFYTSDSRTADTFHTFQHGYTRYETSLSISVNITSGSSKVVNLEAPSGYKWKEVWMIQIAGNSNPFYVYYNFTNSSTSTTYRGWLNGISSEKLTITSTGNTTSVTFKNNDSTTRTVTPCCIWGYLESV